MNNIKIKAYGKVNLSLDVTGVRDDGYHVIRTVMQKISLHDDVDVTWTPSKTDKIEISLDCNRPYLPKDSRNLAYQAAVIMGDSFGEKAGGGKIQINIEKRLPVAAGLAGGSGNGAAVIIALNKYGSWDLIQGSCARSLQILVPMFPSAFLRRTPDTDVLCAKVREQS